MAGRFEKFTKSFARSAIPFLLCEIVTNGKGEMVDVVCRFANAAASSMLERPPEQMLNLRLGRILSPEVLPAFVPMEQVAFSGSSASFPYRTALGRELSITCYQVMYGVCGCILEEFERPAQDVRSVAEVVDACFPGGTAVLEVGRRGARCLSCSPQFDALSGYSHRDLITRFSGDFSGLIVPEDWPGLLQCLLDAARSRQSAVHEFRVLCRDGTQRWVELRADRLSRSEDATVFYALVLDAHSRRALESELLQLRAQLRDTASLSEDLFALTPSLCALFSEGRGGRLGKVLRVSHALSVLLGQTPEEAAQTVAASPLWRGHPAPGQPSPRRRGEEHRILRPFSVRCGDATERWLVPAVSALPRSGGESVVLAAYTDVTAQRSAQQDLQFAAELNELLLAGSGVTAVNYDPLTDTARLTGYDAAGQRSIRTVSACSETVPPLVHADSREALQTALREACSKPCGGTLRCRVAGSGGPHRWYEARYVSLAGEDGSVYRVAAVLRGVGRRREDGSPLPGRPAVLEALAGREFRFVLTVDAVTDTFTSHGAENEIFPAAGDCFSAAAQAAIARFAAPQAQPSLGAALSLAYLVRRLKTAPGVELAVPLRAGGRICCRCSWLDRPAKLLLVTGRNLPEEAEPLPEENGSRRDGA